MIILNHEITTFYFIKALIHELFFQYDSECGALSDDAVFNKNLAFVVVLDDAF